MIHKFVFFFFLILRCASFSGSHREIPVTIFCQSSQSQKRKAAIRTVGNIHCCYISVSQILIIYFFPLVLRRILKYFFRSWAKFGTGVAGQPVQEEQVTADHNHADTIHITLVLMLILANFVAESAATYACVCFDVADCKFCC